MAQKNTLFNYFSKSPAQPKVQKESASSPSQTNDKGLQKSKAATPTSGSKKVTKSVTPKIGRKRGTATSATDDNKQNEGIGN
jgi:phage antirepressor YoqD-like protein